MWVTVLLYATFVLKLILKDFIKNLWVDLGAHIISIITT